MNQRQYNLLRTLHEDGGWPRAACDGRVLAALLRRGEVEEKTWGTAAPWVRVTPAGLAALEATS